MNTLQTVTPVTPTETLASFETLERRAKFDETNRLDASSIKGLSEADTITLGAGLYFKGEAMQSRSAFVFAEKFKTLDGKGQSHFTAGIRQYVANADLKDRQGNKLTKEQSMKRADGMLTAMKAAVFILENPSVKSNVYTVVQALGSLKDKEKKAKLMPLLKNNASQSEVKAKVQSFKTPPEAETSAEATARVEKEKQANLRAKSAEGRIESYVASLRDANRHWDLCIDAKASVFQIQKASVSEFVALAKSYRLELIALETATEVKVRLK